MGGYAEAWGHPAYRTVYLDGRSLIGLQLKVSRENNELDKITMEDGSVVLQTFIRGGTAPSSVSPQTWTIGFDLSDRGDHQHAYACLGRGVFWFPEWPITDRWPVLPGQTNFSTSRRLPYGGLVPGVTTTSHPAYATVDGVEQVVIYTGTPSEGEVLVSATSGAQWRSVQTPELAPGSVLCVSYCPVYRVTVLFGEEIPQLNELQVEATITETPDSRWD